jgi:hypothetical protein
VIGGQQVEHIVARTAAQQGEQGPNPVGCDHVGPVVRGDRIPEELADAVVPRACSLLVLLAPANPPSLASSHTRCPGPLGSTRTLSARWSSVGMSGLSGSRPTRRPKRCSSSTPTCVP